MRAKTDQPRSISLIAKRIVARCGILPREIFAEFFVVRGNVQNFLLSVEMLGQREFEIYRVIGRHAPSKGKTGYPYAMISVLETLCPMDSRTIISRLIYVPPSFVCCR